MKVETKLIMSEIVLTYRRKYTDCLICSRFYNNRRPVRKRIAQGERGEGEKCERSDGGDCDQSSDASDGDVFGYGRHGSRNYDEGPGRGEKDAVYDV